VIWTMSCSDSVRQIKNLKSTTLSLNHTLRKAANVNSWQLKEAEQDRVDAFDCLKIKLVFETEGVNKDVSSFLKDELEHFTPELEHPTSVTDESFGQKEKQEFSLSDSLWQYDTRKQAASAALATELLQVQFERQLEEFENFLDASAHGPLQKGDPIGQIPSSYQGLGFKLKYFTILMLLCV